MMMYNAGTRTSVTAVANRTPAARATAIGIKNWACRLVSSINGVTPAAVVRDVSKIARNLASPAYRTAFPREALRRTFWLMNATITKESLTTTPASATIPHMDRKLTSMPRIA